MQGKVDDLLSQNIDFDILITCDTIVVDNKGVIIEKPEDHNYHKEMLRRLSGTWHDVISAMVIIIQKNGMDVTERHLGKTRVFMSEIPELAIEKYGEIIPDVFKHSEQYEVGTYGLSLIERVEGDWRTAISLPLNALARILHKNFHDE